MNSYFEQSGFYGHPHQAAAGMMTAASTGSHHDQTSAAAAAYRGFPLSLGMSPYANHHLHQTRTAQDSPYDASITAACKQIYDGAYNKDCVKTGATTNGNGTTGSSGTTGGNTTNSAAETNGYKDVWNSTGSTGTQNSASVPVRPSACTPDSRVGGYIDAAGGSPVSRTGSSAAGGGVTGSSWNTNCQIGSTAAQTASSASLHQNHTFYPWMAIAGECPTFF
jgi:Antp family protein